MPDLFLGVDAGGSNTRAVLATANGTVIGMGRADGANTWSSGTSISDVVSHAVHDAVGSGYLGQVVRGVIGVAGSLTADDIAGEITAAWMGLELPGAPDIVPDVLVAYAAGTTAADGAVLVAGTGSIAAAIRGRELHRHAGGHGWLLGDEGSAVWLGLQGIRLALSALDGRGRATRLADTIPNALQIPSSDAESAMRGIVRAAYRLPPARLGRLAPIVLEAAAEGDPVARALVEEGVQHLGDLVAAVIDDERTVIVLTGSLVTMATLIGGPLRMRVAERWPAARVTETASGEAGAVALAIERSTGTPVAPATLARLRREIEARQSDVPSISMPDHGPGGPLGNP